MTNAKFMRRGIWLAIFFLWAFLLRAGPLQAQDDEEPRGHPIVLGYLENVSVGELGLSMKAKLDTGADTSSVFARDIDVYRRGHKDNWVKFRLVGKNGRSIRYDQNVIRFARIKTKTGGSIRRPVIHLPICVGGQTGLAEINLADRSDFEFDVLIGREFLAQRIIVDSGVTFAAEDTCTVSDKPADAQDEGGDDAADAADADRAAAGTGKPVAKDDDA